MTNLLWFMGGCLFELVIITVVMKGPYHLKRWRRRGSK